MADGADVIYQATFFDGTWRGHADFLLRVDDPARPSVWGLYHYEVADTKLARHVKASAVLQICSYVDQLERIQGVRPEWIHVALGGSARSRRAPARRRLHGVLPQCPRPVPGDDGRTQTPATYPPGDDLSGSRRPLRRLPLGRRVRRAPPRGRSPEPRRRDHPPASASAHGARASPRCEALGDLALPLRAAARGHERPGAPERVREQARIQLGGPADRALPLRAARCPIPARRSRPSAAWPRSRRRRPGDLFFDIEGDPFAFEDGLDYLFGVLRRPTARSMRSGRATRTASSPWTPSERAFEQLIDFVIDRLERRPGPARLPLRAVRADRAQAPDGSLRDARGRGRPAAPARASSSTSSASSARGCGRRSRATRSRRWSRSTASSATIDLRDAGQQHRRLRAVAGARRGRAAGRRPPRADRALQPDDVVSNRQLRDWLGVETRGAGGDHRLRGPATGDARAGVSDERHGSADPRAAARRPPRPARRHPRGAGERTPDAARTLAAGPAARLASARGQGRRGGSSSA